MARFNAAGASAAAAVSLQLRMGMSVSRWAVWSPPPLRLPTVYCLLAARTPLSSMPALPHQRASADGTDRRGAGAGRFDGSWLTGGPTIKGYTRFAPVGAHGAVTRVTETYVLVAASEMRWGGIHDHVWLGGFIIRPRDGGC